MTDRRTLATAYLETARRFAAERNQAALDATLAIVERDHLYRELASEETADCVSLPFLCYADFADAFARECAAAATAERSTPDDADDPITRPASRADDEDPLYGRSWVERKHT